MDFTFAPLALADLPFLIDVRNECREFLHDNRLFTLTECERWFLETKPDFRIIRYNGRPIGYFRLSNYDPDAASIYIGADLQKDFRGQGLARRAYEAFFPIVQQVFTVAVLKLEVLSHNTAARALYEKIGFVEIERKKALATRNGLPVDSIVMEKSIGKEGGLSSSR